MSTNVQDALNEVAMQNTPDVAINLRFNWFLLLYVLFTITLATFAGGVYAGRNYERETARTEARAEAAELRCTELVKEKKP